MANVDYKSKEPFGIDGEELDGLTPQEVFVLGYELAQVSAEMEHGQKIEKPVHTDNRERIERAADIRGRTIGLIVYHDDWLWLETTDGIGEDEA